MTNAEIAAVLYEIADYLEAKNVAFKPQAYRQAADFIERSAEPLQEVYGKGGAKALEELPNIGKNMAKKIAELLETGRLKYLEKLHKELPVHMAELTAIEDVGPKTVKTLYQKLKIRSVADLEKAARRHRIHTLPGFGEKKEQQYLRGLKLLKERSGRMPRRLAAPIASRIVQRLKRLKEIEAVEAGGSLRRGEATVGDIDIVAASAHPKKVMEAFVALPDVERVYSTGPTKTLVRLKAGIDADLRVVPPKSFGAALQYFTGSKAHNIALRNKARSLKLKLNEYGVFKGKKRIAGRTEEEVYAALGEPYRPPEERRQ